MGKKGPRPTEFVCCGIANNRLNSKSIEAKTPEEAMGLFEKEFGIKPESIHGPYYRQRGGVLDNTREIEFSNERKKSIYRDWYVVACLLKHPLNCAYLLFDKRVDGKKVPKPVGTFIVKLEELKDLQ